MSVHSLDKLAPKVIKTIFTGYPPNQKGYKFFDHVIKITHGSRHVVFHEHIFPFKTQIMLSYILHLLLSSTHLTLLLILLARLLLSLLLKISFIHLL